MSLARSGMLDLFVDPNRISDPDQKEKIIQSVETLLDKFSLKKEHDFNVGGSYVIVYSSPKHSMTCLLRIYPFGLITVTFEESMEVSPFINATLDQFKFALQKELGIRIDKIPAVKRGLPVPNFFTTSDERILEYDFDQVVYQAKSEYQKITILHSPTLGNVLLLDDLQNLGEKDIAYTHGIMKYGILSYTDKDILILGGGDGGLLYELLKENPKFVTLVDIDKMVVDACRLHLRGACGNALDSLKGDNYEVIIDDCIEKLNEFVASGKKFDFVINDLTDIPISPEPHGELWAFVRKVMTKSLEVLKDDGHYLNHAIGKSCSDSLQQYEHMLTTLPVKLNFVSHSAFVPSFMEDWVFYDITKV